MKKVVLSMLAVALIATAADATLIGIRWKDQPAVQSKVGLLPGAPAIIQVYITQIAGDPEIEGIGSHLNAWSNSTATTLTTVALNQDSTATVLPNWVVSGPGTVNGQVNVGITQFGTFDPTHAGTGTGAGTFVLAELTVHYDPAVEQDVYITMDRTTMTLVGAGGNQPYGDLAGAKWDKTQANVKSGYIAYGNWGNPGWGSGTKGQKAANGLILHVTPEPASLALLVLGGFAALRRR